MLDDVNKNEKNIKHEIRKNIPDIFLSLKSTQQQFSCRNDVEIMRLIQR